MRFPPNCPQIQIGSTSDVLLACRAYSKRSTPVDGSDGYLYVFNDFWTQTAGSWRWCLDVGALDGNWVLVNGPGWMGMAGRRLGHGLDLTVRRGISPFAERTDPS